MEKGEEGTFPEQTKSVKKKKNSRLSFGMIGLIIVFAIAAIFGLPKLFNSADDSALEPTPTNTQISVVETPTDTPTPDGPALGSVENPIIWMYVPNPNSDFTEISAAADEVASLFQEYTEGLILKPIPATDTSSLLDALCENAIHIGSLGSFSYLVASDRECAEVKLLWNVYSDIKYGGMVIINSSNDISAIEELRGRSLCIPIYASTSGWLLPSLEIMASIGDPQTFFSEIIEMGSHDAVIDAVYSGECDIGTAFYDARNNSNMPDINERVLILSTTTTLPKENISFVTGLDLEISQNIIEFFKEISTQSTSLALMNGVHDSSNVNQLIEINDFYFDEIRGLFLRAGENPEDYIPISIFN